MRILFVGGGTGGHFYPLIAIAESIRERAEHEQAPVPLFYYMGPDQFDEAALQKVGMAYHYCPSGKMRRYASIWNFFDIFALLYGTIVAIIKLFSIYPDVVMSKGGYTSVPVVLAAVFLRIPLVVHESDAVPGRANLFAGKFAQYIAVSYPNAVHFFPKEKTALTGIPLSKPASTVGTSEATARPVIFVTGGSHGAQRVNDLILQSLSLVLPSYDIFHQTGSANEKMVKETAETLIKDEALRARYHAIGYLEPSQMDALLSKATVVVARAGSNTIALIARSAKPSILIPIPESISHAQLKNAYAYAENGAASVMEEHNLTPHLLSAEIERILSNADVRERMIKASAHFVFPQAADTLARAIIDIGMEHGS